MAVFNLYCSRPIDYKELPAITNANTINCVIEIPAGTNKKIEYSDSENDFLVDIRDRRERIIAFLPYPANYGFVPSTESRLAEGGDGDHLDVLVLAESMATGTVVEAIPVAILKLLDEGENDYKIICVPADIELQIIKADGLEDLRQNYPAIIDILEMWFTNYDSRDRLEVLGWGDEVESLKEIHSSIVSGHCVIMR